jgi:hypothetical protein
MTVEEKVQAVLVANSDLIARVATNRIKVPGDWQEMVLPYIIHQPVSGQVTQTHSGAVSALRQWDFYEVSVYAYKHSEARELADLVVAALDGYRDDDVDLIGLSSPPNIGEFDTDRKVARVTLDFEISGALT